MEIAFDEGTQRFDRMIAKADSPPAAEPPRKKRRAVKKDTVDLELTLRFNFGDAPGDRVTVMDAQRVPMVGSVIANRDRILRGFLRLMLRTAARQPAVARELFPWINRKARRRANGKNPQ